MATTHAELLRKHRVALTEKVDLVVMWDNLIQERVVTKRIKENIICNVCTIHLVLKIVEHFCDTGNQTSISTSWRTSGLFKHTARESVQWVL